MKLNKDGTATLTLDGKEVVLQSPSWNQLKDRKSAFETLVENANQITKPLVEKASPEALRVWEKLTARTDEAQTEGSVEYLALSPEDQEMVISIANAVKEQGAVAQELVMGWWVDTINAVSGVEVEAGDLPAYLANTNKIESYLKHVQTVPFLSGP
jgi:hypothetical protein